MIPQFASAIKDLVIEPWNVKTIVLGKADDVALRAPHPRASPINIITAPKQGWNVRDRNTAIVLSLISDFLTHSSHARGQSPTTAVREN